MFSNIAQIVGHQVWLNICESWSSFYGYKIGYQCKDFSSAIQKSFFKSSFEILQLLTAACSSLPTSLLYAAWEDLLLIFKLYLVCAILSPPTTTVSGTSLARTSKENYLHILHPSISAHQYLQHSSRRKSWQSCPTSPWASWSSGG